MLWFWGVRGNVSAPWGVTGPIKFENPWYTVPESHTWVEVQMQYQTFFSLVEVQVTHWNAAQVSSQPNIYCGPTYAWQVIYFVYLLELIQEFPSQGYSFIPQFDKSCCTGSKMMS